MAPLREDPGEWEAVMRFIKSIIDWLLSSPFAGLTIPAFFGAFIGRYRAYLKNNRRVISKLEFIGSVVMSAVVGCGLTPLFAHIADLPDNVATSLAFFLGFWGLRSIDFLNTKIGIHDDAPHDDK